MGKPTPWMATLLLALGGASAAAAQESTYSTFDYERCAQARSPEPGVIDVRRCKGPAGLPVHWHAEPDSSHIEIGRLTGPFSFGSAAYEVNNVVEWRWRDRGAKWPQAAIVRYRHGRSISNLNRSRLVVYRIEADGRSCVLDTVEGAKANEKARRIADRAASAKRCAR